MKHNLKLDVLTTLLFDSKNPKVIKDMPNNDFFDSLVKKRKKDPLPECAIAYLDPFQSTDWYDIPRVQRVRLTEVIKTINEEGEKQYGVKFEFIKEFHSGEYKVEFDFDSKSDMEVPKYVTFNDVYSD